MMRLDSPVGACFAALLALAPAHALAQDERFSWIRGAAAVGNNRRMTVDQGVTPGTFRYVGSTGASAQQIYLGTETTLYVVDKTERNDNLTIGGHPAWATEIDLTTWTIRPLDITTNSFCAGGAVSGNGSLVNVGGNNAITTSGADTNTAGLGDQYHDQAGGRVMRVMDPCVDGTCNWVEWQGMQINRWYPTLETLGDGTVLIIGGELYGGYVNMQRQLQNNPTAMIWPNGAEQQMPFLARTQPLNLFPITFLLPTGEVFVNAGYDCISYNPWTRQETVLANLPQAVRVYPAAGASAMLPLSSANNWTPSILMCGGNAQANDQDVYDNTRVNITAFAGSQSCSRLDLANNQAQWYADDNLLEGRVMGEFVNLPDGTLFLVNGASQGTAGYGWYPQWIPNQQGYGSGPLHLPAIYDPRKPAGQRWSRDGLQPAAFSRMYHSVATLLPDGSVLIAGSNPNADFIGVTSNGDHVNATDTFWTVYGAEKFYPWYYSMTRPQPTGVPMSIQYGGAYFDVGLPAGTVNSTAQLANIQFVVIRTGFVTHGVHMGQRHVTLDSTVTVADDGSLTLHVASAPSPNIIPPGPALGFVVVNGVPSIGQMIMFGNGRFGVQNTAAAQQLPPTSGTIVADPINAASPSSSSGPATPTRKSAANLSARVSAFAAALAFAVALAR